MRAVPPQINLLTVFGICLFMTACLGARTPAATPLPFAREIASPEPTIDTFQSANARIRMFGVDTPDLGEPCFAEATERFRELAGETVRVEFGPRQEDRYGRILYYVYTN